MFLGLFFTLALSNLFASAPSIAQLVRGGARGAAVAAALCLTGMSAKYVIEAGHAVPNDMVTPLSRLVREHASGGAIAVLGMRTFIYPAFPLVNQTGVAWSLRHNGLWFLPGFYVQELQGPTSDVPFHTPAAMSHLEREFFDEIVSDLCTRPPEL